MGLPVNIDLLLALLPKTGWAKFRGIVSHLFMSITKKSRLFGGLDAGVPLMHPSSPFLSARSVCMQAQEHEILRPIPRPLLLSLGGSLGGGGRPSGAGQKNMKHCHLYSLHCCLQRVFQGDFVIMGKGCSLPSQPYHR